MRIQTWMLGLLVLLCVLVLAGCGHAENSSDGDAPDGDAPDGDAPDGDAPDGDAPDGDTPDGDAPDGDAPDGDIPDKPEPFLFAVISDTHVIDDFYNGREGNELDTETIYLTRERFAAARDQVNAIADPAVEQVLIPGDVAHNYPSDDWDFYFENETRFDIAKTLIDSFNMPVYVGLGNHDYDIPDVSREFTHDLLKEKWGIDPYYSIDYKGIRFIHLNNFLGDTMDPESPIYGQLMGSFGEEQLDWLEDQLSDGIPSFIFIHYPLLLAKRNEFPDRDVLSILRDNSGGVLCVFGGHHHRWQKWEIGGVHTYGVPHLVVGSTRYDEDNILYIVVDPETGDWELQNHDCIDWGGMYANPYTPGEVCEPPVSE